jgi:hypothetical protein
MDSRKIAELLRGSNGPVTRRLIEDGELVKVAAKRECPVYVPPAVLTFNTRERRSGTLRDSIVKRVVQNSSSGVSVLVGSDDPVSLWVHEGTVPHTITARLKPLLVFYSRRQQRIVRVKSVQHPGTQPNRFLIRALAVLKGRY